MIVAFVKKKRSQIVAFKIRKIIHIHIYELCFSLGLSGKQKKNNFPSSVGKARKGTIEFGAKKFGKIIAQIEQKSSLGP